MSLPRERVIVDIEDLEQAAKVEETVSTGYCDTIKDDLTHWIAVEEDIVDSYARLSKRLEPGIGQRIDDLAEESRGTVRTLQELLKSFEVLGQQRTSRVKMIRDMETTLT